MGDKTIADSPIEMDKTGTESCASELALSSDLGRGYFPSSVYGSDSNLFLYL